MHGVFGAAEMCVGLEELVGEKQIGVWGVDRALDICDYHKGRECVDLPTYRCLYACNSEVVPPY